MRPHHIRLAAAIVFTLIQTCTHAEDVFLAVKAAQVTVSDGTLPDEIKPGAWLSQERNQTMEPYIILDGPGEAYVLDGTPYSVNENSTFTSSYNYKFTQTAKLAFRIPTAREITGKLIVPKEDYSAMLALPFKIPAQAKREPDPSKLFFQAQSQHYQKLIARNAPGAAWFRFQRDNLSSSHKLDLPNVRQNRPNRGDFAQETFDVFTGGRAISENLQLDRRILINEPGEATVSTDTLPGITVAEIDWKDLVKDAKPKLDPLAAAVPSDQHVIFFPSFQSMVELSDEADAHGTPVLQLLEPRAEDARTGKRLHKQLCLEVSQVSRLMGPAFIASVAFTGSDPYLRSGSDVAVLFEARNVASLQGFLATKHAAALKSDPKAKEVKGDLNGVAYTGLVTPDRSISSYIATSGDTVAVTNSLAQLSRILSAAQGTTPSLKSLPEYTFFRSRYVLGNKDETALLILTDATIRRWCGPRWRIANARRTYAAAALSELQARHADEIARGTIIEGPIANDFTGLGEVTITPAGVRSSIYNTLDFMTPIAELSLDKVTEKEAAAYKTWRDGYQQNWRQYFDPIAVRLGVTPKRLQADVTVMPLIAGTEYREIMKMVEGAKIDAKQADRHAGEILNFNIAFNAKDDLVDWLWDKAGSKPSEWMGQTITVFQDDSNLWTDLLKSNNPNEFWEKRTSFPVGISIAVRDEAKMRAFYDSIPKLINDNLGAAAANLQQLNEGDQRYWKIPLNHIDEKILVHLYVAALPDALLFSLDESVLKRMFERRAKKDEKQPDPAIPPILGEHLALFAKKKILDVLEHSMREGHAAQLQRLSWNNLPILNEWKRLYPDSDPVTLHEKLWGVTLVCPAGGKYVWNEKFQTMESTTLGHPAEPKTPAANQLNMPLAKLLSGNFGLTFENKGLRAKVVIDRTP